MIKTKRNQLMLVTVLIVAGIGLIYTMLLSPSPLLLTIGAHFGIANDVQLNMVVNIAYLFITIGCAVGGKLEQRIGTKRMYSLALGCTVAGSLVLVASVLDYSLLLIGRSLYGLGYGLAVPFFGAAVMRWYEPLSREKMDTVNALFPFIGPFICLVATVPLYHALGEQWNLALAIWGIPVAMTLLLWTACVKEDRLVVQSTDADSEACASQGLYRRLLKIKTVRLLLLACMCDYACYSYVGCILPMYLVEAAQMTESVATVVSAWAFPAVGVVGIILSGAYLVRVGLRKPMLVSGQVLEVVGLVVASLGVYHSTQMIIVGVALFAFGNAIWTPALFIVPMELKGMNPVLISATFALIGVVGEGFGFLAPSLGGALTETISGLTNATNPVFGHAVALAWGLLAFGAFNVVGVVSTLLIKETGTRRRQ